MTSVIDLCREAATCFLPAGTTGKWHSSSEEAVSLQSILTSREAQEKSQIPPTSSEDTAITECTVSMPRSMLNCVVFQRILCY